MRKTVRHYAQVVSVAGLNGGCPVTVMTTALAEFAGSVIMIG
jgi:hypothetical protein